MGPDRTPLAEDSDITEDNRSHNTKVVDQLDRGPNESGVQQRDEPEEQFDVEIHLEEGSPGYDTVEAEIPELEEEGMPKEFRDGMAKVREFLIDQLGYNPDVEDYATFGDVTVRYNSDSIDVFYEVGENLSSPTELTAPLLQDVEPEVLEQSIAGGVPHAATKGYESDGKTGVQFRYRDEDWIIATEEIGDAINEFESDLDLENYSGR